MQLGLKGQLFLANSLTMYPNVIVLLMKYCLKNYMLIDIVFGREMNESFIKI